jgi:hypothetical protein
MNKFGITPAEVVGESHPLFRGMLFVSAARSNDDTRPALAHIKIERDNLSYRMIATDGKRLHVSEMDPGMFDDDIQPLLTGLYEVIAKSAKYIVIARNDEEDIKYPQWQHLMNERDPEHHDIITSRSIARLGIRTGQLLATDFAIEACGLGHGFKKDADVAIEYSPCPNGGGFLITHELGKAIVMPLRMHDAETAKDDIEATPTMPGFEPADKPAQTPPLAGMEKMLSEAGATAEIHIGDKVVSIGKGKKK